MTPWTIVHQVPPSTGFSRQEYWSGLPCPPPGDLLHRLHCRRILYLLSHQKVNYPRKRSASSKSSRAWTLPVVSATSFYDLREGHCCPLPPQETLPRPVGRSGPGSCEVTAVALHPSTHETLCAPSEPGPDGKESACNAGDSGSIPGSLRSPGKGNGNPLQYSCLENLMDGGA